MADSKYSYDVFYRIGDGYGEHIQVWADDIDTLLKGREELNKSLKALGAGPLPRDIAYASKSTPTEAPLGKNPNRLPDAPSGNGSGNFAPVCPKCGQGPMRQRNPDPDKGQTWPSFWSCKNYPRCDGKRNMT